MKSQKPTGSQRHKTQAVRGHMPIQTRILNELRELEQLD